MKRNGKTIGHMVTKNSVWGARVYGNITRSVEINLAITNLCSHMKFFNVDILATPRALASHGILTSQSSFNILIERAIKTSIYGPHVEFLFHSPNI